MEKAEHKDFRKPDEVREFPLALTAVPEKATARSAGIRRSVRFFCILSLHVDRQCWRFM